MHCDSRKLVLVLQPSVARQSGAKQPSKSTTNYRAKTKYFDLNLFCINMPRTFTFIRGSLRCSVKIWSRVRGGRQGDDCSIPGSRNILYSNSQPPDLIQRRPNILFNGQQGILRLGGGYTKGHTRYCGLRRGLQMEISQYLVYLTA